MISLTMLLSTFTAMIENLHQMVVKTSNENDALRSFIAIHGYNFRSMMSLLKIRGFLENHIFPTFIYFIITIILTYPVAFVINTRIPGGGDAYQWMRILWYTRFAILNPNLTTLRHDSMIFYPSGIDTIAFYSFFNQMISFLLLNFLDINVIYAILWLLTFIIGSYGTYLLVDYLINNKIASFVAGIIFAFNPYHYAHGLGHLGATTILWIPFSALYLMKCFREPPNTKNCFLAGIFFILVAMSDLQYMIFMGLFAFLLFFYELCIILTEDGFHFETQNILNMFKKYLIFAVTALVGIIPLTFNEIITASLKGNFLKPEPHEAITYSTDLLSFFLPSVFHTVFGRIMEPIYANFTGNNSEYTTYIGYTVIVLSIIAFSKFRSDRIVKFWLLSAIFFSLMSLGPVLHINGHIEFTQLHLMIPLPFLLISNIVPYLENVRTTGRFFVIAILSFSVLGGYGISWLMKSNRYQRNLIVIFIAALIIFEYLNVPYYTSYVDHPSFYKNISEDKSNYALLEIPATKVYDAGVKIMYYQTIHHKPIVGGQAARTPSDAWDFEKNTPFVNELTFLEYPNDILNQNLTKIGGSILNLYNIKYIIIHNRNYLTEGKIQFADSLLRSALKVKPVIYKNDSLIVYEVPRLPVTPFISVVSGFYDPEYWFGAPTRWIRNDAALQIYSDKNCTAHLSLRALSLNSSRTLVVYSGNSQTARISVPTDFVNVSAPIYLIRGANVIHLSVPEGCERPVDITMLKNNDSRCLSLAIQNISWQEVN